MVKFSNSILQVNIWEDIIWKDFFNFNFGTNAKDDTVKISNIFKRSISFTIRYERMNVYTVEIISKNTNEIYTTRLEINSSISK